MKKILESTVSTYYGISWQQIQEITSHIPFQNAVPQCSLEIIASIQVNWIFILSLFQKRFNSRHYSGISSNACFTHF